MYGVKVAWDKVTQATHRPARNTCGHPGGKGKEGEEEAVNHIVENWCLTSVALTTDDIMEEIQSGSSPGTRSRSSTPRRGQWDAVLAPAQHKMCPFPPAPTFPEPGDGKDVDPPRCPGEVSETAANNILSFFTPPLLAAGSPEA